MDAYSLPEEKADANGKGNRTLLVERLRPGASMFIASALVLLAFLTGCAVEKRAVPTAYTEALSDLRTIENALVTYRNTTGTWPNNGDGLRALVRPPRSAPRGWRALLPAVPIDPWGRTYQYRYNPGLDRISVWSFGEDVVNSSDDVRLDRIAGLSR